MGRKDCKKNRNDSIIILNYNNYNVTKDCVSSIQQQYKNEINIVIVDNGSSNNSFDELSQAYSNENNIYIIKTKKNNGFAIGNNIGIEKCRELGSEYCILANSDIIFLENSISLLFSSIRNLKDAVIVGPKIIDENRNVWFSSKEKPLSWLEAVGFNRFLRGKRVDESKINSPIKVCTVSGCCFAINISRFKSMGAFDQNTFLYNEENILGAQSKNAKYNIYLDPEPIVQHLHAKSTNNDITFQMTEYTKSLIYYCYYYRKWRQSLIWVTINILLLKYSIKKILKMNEIDLKRYRKEVYTYYKKIGSVRIDAREIFK